MQRDEERTGDDGGGPGMLVDAFAHLEGLVARLLDAIGQPRTLTQAKLERLVDEAWANDVDELVPLITAVELLAKATGVALEEELHQPLLRSNEGFTYEKRSWFHVACARGNVNTVKSFVERCGLDPTQADADLNAQTPLHVAAAQGRLEVVRFLLKHCGADLVKRDDAGRTPLGCAEQHDQSQVVSLIESWDPSLDKGVEEETKGELEPSTAIDADDDLDETIIEKTMHRTLKQIKCDAPVLDEAYRDDLEGLVARLFDAIGERSALQGGQPLR
ncbi:MAG: ankyrin repeat domain-containing protein, partial [Planctomycetota bacterium]